MAPNNGFSIAQYQNRFSDIAFQSYCSGILDYDQTRYLSAVVWSAVFIEALLKDILRAYGTEIDPKKPPKLDAMIHNINALQDATAEDRARYLLISRKCETIKNERNSLLHDNGLEKMNVKETADAIYNSCLNVVVNLYLDTAAAKKIEETRRASATVGETPPKEADFPIFVSTITPFTLEQELFIESFCSRLQEIGAKPVRCRQEDFGTKKPMEVVCKMISECNAVVVLGLEKYHVYHHMEKKGSAKPREEINRSFSSEWLQIESGMAFGLGKKVFVIHQQGLHRQGIFDHEWNSVTPLELDGPLDAKCSEVDVLLRDIKEYMEEYKK